MYFANTLNVLHFPIWINEYPKMNKGSVTSTSSPNFGSWKFVYCLGTQKEYFPSRVLPLLFHLSQKMLGFPEETHNCGAALTMQPSACSWFSWSEAVLCRGSLCRHAHLLQSGGAGEATGQNTAKIWIVIQQPSALLWGRQWGLAGMFGRETPS